MMMTTQERWYYHEMILDNMIHEGIHRVTDGTGGAKIPSLTELIRIEQAPFSSRRHHAIVLCPSIRHQAVITANFYELLVLFIKARAPQKD